MGEHQTGSLVSSVLRLRLFNPFHCSSYDEHDSTPSLVCHKGRVNVTIKISKNACVCHADQNNVPSQ